MARTKLNAEMVDELGKLLREGHYISTACACMGIVEQTYYKWVEKGEADPTSIYGEFREAMEKARAQAHAAALREIRSAALPWTKKTTKRTADGEEVTISDEPGSWQAAAWFLERTAPDKFGRRQVSVVELEDHRKTIDLVTGDKPASDAPPGPT